MIPHVNDSKEIVDDEVSYDYQKAKEIKWYHHLLLNRPLKIFITLLLAAVVAPLIIYQFLFFNRLDQSPSDGYSFGSCLLPRNSRVQCGIQTGNHLDCHPQCCFDFDQNVCFHRFPSRFTYITAREWAEEIVLHPRISTVPYGSAIVTNMRLSIDEISATHLSLTFYNSLEMSLQGKRIDEKNYTYRISNPELNVMVNGTQGIIFNTMRGPLIASNNIWEIAFLLTEESLYGLGEIPLKQNTIKVIYNHDGGLSSIPLIFAKLNGSYHGLLIDTKDPTEVEIQGDNQIVIRSITTEGLKFHIFVGPKPEDIMRDVMKLVGYNFEVEYWMLGAHVCSDVSTTSNDAYQDLSNFLDNASKEKFYFESHCGTKSIVFDNNCGERDDDYVESGEKLLRSYNKRYVPHVSPFIRYEKVNETSEENDINPSKNNECSILTKFDKLMYRTADSKEIYTGLVLDDDVIYPDYENASYEFMKALWTYNTTLDGLVLENSWPLDESYKNHSKTYRFLPYFSKNFEVAFNHTPPWNITRPSGKKYLYNHNDYGNNFADALRKLSDEKIPLLSTSQWMNGNVAINRQNINASWTNLQRELTEAALGGISGHWLWSSPICGDTEHFDPETQTNLCVKWYMAATYLPLIKIHSKSVERNPMAFVGTNKMYMTTALNRRICFLPYIYTTLQEGPLLRPMFYQFPASESLKNLTSQYSVGDDLLIVPNLLPNQSHVHVWMPPGSWFEIWSGLKLDGVEGEAVTLTTTDADFLTLVRGGSIIVMQQDVKETAESTRLRSDLSLTIALNCVTLNNNSRSTTNTTECKANGKLNMSKDMSLTFEANSKQLFIKAKGKGFKLFCDKEALWANKINEISVFGLDVEYNNYDNSRKVQASIELCQLESSNEIIYSFV